MSKKVQNFKYNQKAAEKKKQARASNQNNTKRNSARRSIGKSSRKTLPTKEEIEENLKLLKTVLVDDKNIKTIETSLKITATKRMQLLKNKQFDFLENFPCLFTHPQLVSIKNTM